MESDYSELLGRYARWRDAFALAGYPILNEPDSVDGDLHFRSGYPNPEWTAYVIRKVEADYAVLRVSTERRNEPIEGLQATFSTLELAGKYVIFDTGENLRVKLRVDPVTWGWRDSGLDSRVVKNETGNGMAKYVLSTNPDEYFVRPARGITPINHLLPLSYGEVDALLLEGLPAAVVQRFSRP